MFGFDVGGFNKDEYVQYLTKNIEIIIKNSRG